MTIKSHGTKQKNSAIVWQFEYPIFDEIKSLTKYRRHPIPDSSDFQRTREDSNTSMEKTAPDMAPIADPRMKPLSVSCPIKAPVIAPNKVPTTNKTNNL